MFQSDWLILSILHQSFEIEIPKGPWSEVVVHLYIKQGNNKTEPPPHTGQQPKPRAGGGGGAQMHFTGTKSSP